MLRYLDQTHSRNQTRFYPALTGDDPPPPQPPSPRCSCAPALSTFCRTQVIFYAALGTWTYGAVRLGDMFEAKTREQEAAGFSWRRTRGGGGGTENGDGKQPVRLSESFPKGTSSVAGLGLVRSRRPRSKGRHDR